MPTRRLVCASVSRSCWNRASAISCFSSGSVMWAAVRTSSGIIAGIFALYHPALVLLVRHVDDPLGRVVAGPWKCGLTCRRISWVGPLFILGFQPAFWFDARSRLETGCGLRGRLTTLH